MFAHIKGIEADFCSYQSIVLFYVFVYVVYEPCCLFLFTFWTWFVFLLRLQCGWKHKHNFQTIKLILNLELVTPMLSLSEHRRVTGCGLGRVFRGKGTTSVAMVAYFLGGDERNTLGGGGGVGSVWCHYDFLRKNKQSIYTHAIWNVKLGAACHSSSEIYC